MHREFKTNLWSVRHILSSLSPFIINADLYPYEEGDSITTHPNSVRSVFDNDINRSHVFTKV